MSAPSDPDGSCVNCSNSLGASQMNFVPVISNVDLFGMILDVPTLHIIGLKDNFLTLFLFRKKCSLLPAFI